MKKHIEQRIKFTFFDDYWTDFRKSTVKRYFEPSPYSLGPHGAYASLVFEPKRKVFKLFYEVVPDPKKDGVRVLKMSESYDLKEFTPVLNDEGGDVLYKGGTGLHGCTVMYDDNATDENRRYVLCGMLDMGDREDGSHSNDQTVTLSFSPDGVHWSADRENIVHPRTSDTLNKLFYNPIKNEYSLLMRSAYVDRRISVMRSADLKNWSKPELLIHPAPAYSDGFTQMQLYAMSAKYMNGIFYGLMWRYNTCLYDMEFSKIFGFMEPELYYSYDGVHFMQTSGKPLMQRPAAPNPGCMGLSPNDICESPDGKYYYILCTGAVFCHGSAQSNAEYSKKIKAMNIKRGTPIYKIRKDGFCGLESVGKGGEVIFKPMALKSDEIILNINAACGFVRYGLRKKNGEFLEGFSYDDCIPAEFTDDTAFKAKWKTKSANEIIDKQVRLSVELNSAVLYSVTLDAAPYITERQTSFSNPAAQI